MVTIYDIAEATGYSAPTVSKALTGSGTLSEKTRQKILAVAKEMGYEPNMTARTLATKKSHLIGVIYDDNGMSRGFAHPLFSVVLNRFRDQLDQAGYDIIFLSRKSNMSYYTHAKFRSVDGIIIISPTEFDMKSFEEIIKHNTPCVSTNTIINGICTVLSENKQGGYEAAEYLIKKGHKKIAFLSGPQNNLSSAGIERLEGFKEAFKNHGLNVDDISFEECEFWHRQAGYEGCKRLFERTSDFTAVFACSDTLAYGVMDYAKEHNLSIPDDLSIMGFDDDYGSEFSQPPLTTFRQDSEKIADLAAEMLFLQLSGIPIPQMIRCPSTFVERESVKDITGENQ